ncbi:hypothetical protein FQN55_004663 [Onygenales sp. PD_40]|nr:hypothetical protein FQN55_004663 [Onygenales sp. PD_40]
MTDPNPLLTSTRSNPQFTFPQTTFHPHSFWARRRQTIRSTTLQTQLSILRKTGRYNAFDLAWHPTYDEEPAIWPVPNHLFWDSDVAKWIESVCYYLAEKDEPEMRGAVEELVGKIRAAQGEDGYLNVHFSVVEPEGRFRNLRDLHELYNAGHLIEAALIHHEHFQNNDLLDPIVKYVHYLHHTFGPGPDQLHGYPGHPEIELALLRLWRVTGDTKSLELARYFLEERGNPTGVDGRHYYDVEAEKRGERENEMPHYFPQRRSYWYQQAHKPILEQETIEGHSVRAMYLLTAVADLALIDRASFGQRYIGSLHRLWDNMVDKKMYLTGGVGAMKQWEGFGIDYFLPQGSDEGGCYAETCASIGVMMLAERMLQLDLDSKYADILELCLYNAVLTGMSLDGASFTYVNQLASSPGHPSKREDWFQVSCCPPNVSRVLGYLGGYIWTQKQTHEKSVDINVHLYTAATLACEVDGKQIQLTQRGNWPWGGDMEFEITGAQDIDVTIRLRIPQWAEKFEITPPPPSTTLQRGYLTLPPSYLSTNPTFTLSIPLTPRLLAPHPSTNQQIAAVARGPIIYCLEDVDNTWVTDHFKSVVLDTSVPLLETAGTGLEYPASASPEGEEKIEESYVAITVKDGAMFLKEDGAGWRSGFGLKVEKGRRESLRFVPYFARANRGGKGMMRVGLRVGNVEEV